MQLLLDKNLSVGKGPHLSALFESSNMGILFHVERRGEFYMLHRLRRGRKTHIIKSHIDKPNTFNIRQIGGSTNAFYVMDISEGNFTDFLLSLDRLYDCDIPAENALNIKMTGTPMTKSQIREFTNLITT